MGTPAADPVNAIELIPAAPHQQPILDNLLQLYAHDFSEFHPVELDEDARFHYNDLPLYFADADRHPILFRIRGQWAGFALIKKCPSVSADSTVWDIAEFFVLRRYRSQGVGTHAAHEVWRHFAGPWQIRVMEANVSALRFWARAIGGFFGQPVSASRFEKAGDLWSLFSFTIPGDKS
jgi:predicted acetyltransferase